MIKTRNPHGIMMARNSESRTAGCVLCLKNSGDCSGQTSLAFWQEDTAPDGRELANGKTPKAHGEPPSWRSIASGRQHVLPCFLPFSRTGRCRVHISCHLLFSTVCQEWNSEISPGQPHDLSDFKKTVFSSQVKIKYLIFSWIFFYSCGCPGVTRN